MKIEEVYRRVMRDYVTRFPEWAGASTNYKKIIDGVYYTDFDFATKLSELESPKKPFAKAINTGRSIIEFELAEIKDMGDSYNLHEFRDGLEGNAMLILGTNTVPFIVPAVNYLRIRERYLKKEYDKKIRIELEEEFESMLLETYRKLGTKCRISPLGLHLVLDPDSLTASGAICEIAVMSDEEVDARLAKLAKRKTSI